MKIYLDVSCLNRPFDDQSQPRIRLEAEAVIQIFHCFEKGMWEHVASEMSEIEIAAINDLDRRKRIAALLPEVDNILPLSDGVFRQAEHLERKGFPAADSVHLAAAEFTGADVFLTCDDRLLRRARKLRRLLKLDVANVHIWLAENYDATNT
ncbi:MAG TPA: PIN domain-containing protein [Pirellulales bacterium]|jgi:predicted nucleic acid-binding protein